MKRPVRSAQPYFPPEEMEWVVEEVRSVLEGGILTGGSRVTQFETMFAEHAGVRHAIAVSNGTSALDIALRFYELDGGEVIVPTNTFLASANAVIFAGGVPVLADMEPSSLCIGLEQIEAQLTDRTRGVMVVHIAGMICPQIDAIREFCQRRALFVIEDAAHAHGAEWHGRRAGSLADVGAFSFFPTKPMTTGEGGMITTDDDAIADFARAFRNHGQPEGSTAQEGLGHNYRMDELSAVLGISQTRTLDSNLAVRRSIADQYHEGLSALEDIEVVTPPGGSLHSYYKFPVVLPTRQHRDDVAETLKREHNIDTGTVYWPPCHLQPVVQARPDIYTALGPFTAAENVLPRVLCLPIHARLDTATVDGVIGALKVELRRPVAR